MDKDNKLIWEMWEASIGDDSHTQQILHVMRKRMRELYGSLRDTGHSAQDIYQKAFDVVRDSMLNKAEQESDYKTKHILQDLNFKDIID